MRPIQCAKCGYDLAGLPGAGRCPECGERYWITRGIGIGKRESSQVRGTRLMRRVRTILLGAVGVLVIIAGVAIQLLLAKKHAMLTGGVVGGLLLILAVMSYALEKDAE